MSCCRTTTRAFDPLSGSLRVAAIGPENGGWNGACRPPRGTIDLPVPDLVDRQTLEGAWPPARLSTQVWRSRRRPRLRLDAGVWRFDFIWDGRKIGEREFVISA